MKSIKVIIFVFITTFNALAQEAKDSELFITLKKNDSLLFNEGFNNCDISQFEKLIAEDFEFYHDIAGITESKDIFMKGTRNGLCNPMNTTKSRRELVNASLEVFPLYNQGKLYGALQKGEHKFYETQKGGKEQKGSTAKFTHLWIKTDNKWQIKRVLSYDHKMQVD